jgi:hypothetical protein
MAEVTASQQSTSAVSAAGSTNSNEKLQSLTVEEVGHERDA